MRIIHDVEGPMQITAFVQPLTGMDESNEAGG